MIVAVTASHATGESKALGIEKLRAEVLALPRRTHGYSISIRLIFVII